MKFMSNQFFFLLIKIKTCFFNKRIWKKKISENMGNRLKIRLAIILSNGLKWPETDQNCQHGLKIWPFQFRVCVSIPFRNGLKWNKIFVKQMWMIGNYHGSATKDDMFLCLKVDLDLGNYERFLDIKLTRDNNITTGKIYQVSGLYWLSH